MPYTPDPTQVTQPLDTEKAATAPAEFRALKAYIADTLLAGLNGKLNKAGDTMTGDLNGPRFVATNQEGLRLRHDSAVLYGYNGANTTPTGYIQFFAADGGVDFSASQAAGYHRWMIGGTARWVLNTTGLIPFANNTYDLGSSANRVKKLWAVDADLSGVTTGVTQSAGNNTTRLATTAFVRTEIANLLGAAPATLDTLDELAAALADDANFASTITAALASKLDDSEASTSATANTLARRTASNYLYAGYFNQNSSAENPAIGNVFVESGADGFLRKISLANFINQLPLNARGSRTVSTAGPSGGAEGDIWYQY